MGWAAGSELADLIWQDIRKHVAPAQRKYVARAILKHIESFDCDTTYECEKLIKDAQLPYETDACDV